MARHKPTTTDPNVLPPKDIAASNFDAAIDQFGDYESLAYALAAYRVNVGDTIVEQYGAANHRALFDGLRSYDRQVTKLWEQMKDATKAIRGKAGRVLRADVSIQRDKYRDYQFRGTVDRGRYTEIETEANPSHKRGRKKTRKNPGVSVRKLVQDAMK